MSGWIFKNNNIKKNFNLKEIPIFIGHGDNDKTVLLENAENIKKVLNDNNYYNITLIQYSNMGHNSSSKEIYDIINWLKKFKI
jgi:predicted esterase